MRSREKGAAIVELSVALPVLVVLLVGTADFARVFYTAIMLTSAARAGAQYGAKNIGAGANNTVVESAATASVGLSGVSASASRTCECADGSANFTATSPVANNCTDPPSTSCPATATKFRVITISVTASKTFTTIAPYPGIPRTLPLSRSAVMRVTD